MTDQVSATGSAVSLGRKSLSIVQKALPIEESLEMDPDRCSIVRHGNRPWSVYNCD
jgi:hypothetical protein